MDLALLSVFIVSTIVAYIIWIIICYKFFFFYRNLEKHNSCTLPTDFIHGKNRRAQFLKEWKMVGKLIEDGKKLEKNTPEYDRKKEEIVEAYLHLRITFPELEKWEKKEGLLSRKYRKLLRQLNMGVN